MLEGAIPGPRIDAKGVFELGIDVGRLGRDYVEVARGEVAIRDGVDEADAGVPTVSCKVSHLAMRDLRQRRNIAAERRRKQEERREERLRAALPRGARGSPARLLFMSESLRSRL
jgi:hypothetical protein